MLRSRIRSSKAGKKKNHTQQSWLLHCVQGWVLKKMSRVSGTHWLWLITINHTAVLTALYPIEGSWCDWFPVAMRILCWWLARLRLPLADLPVWPSFLGNRTCCCSSVIKRSETRVALSPWLEGVPLRAAIGVSVCLCGVAKWEAAVKCFCTVQKGAMQVHSMHH